MMTILEMEMLADVMKAGAVTEAYHQTIFRCRRMTKTGRSIGLQLCINDGGLAKATERYYCEVLTDSGYRLNGSARSSVREALEVFSWDKFDHEAPSM
jgi:hypothetical protein